MKLLCIHIKLRTQDSLIVFNWVLMNWNYQWVLYLDIPLLCLCSYFTLFRITVSSAICICIASVLRKTFFSIETENILFLSFQDCLCAYMWRLFPINSLQGYYCFTESIVIQFFSLSIENFEPKHNVCLARKCLWKELCMTCICPACVHLPASYLLKNGLMVNGNVVLL